MAPEMTSADLLSDVLRDGDNDEDRGGVVEGDTEWGLKACKLEAAPGMGENCWCWRNVSKYGMPLWGLSDLAGLLLDLVVQDLVRIESKYLEA